MSHTLNEIPLLEKIKILIFLSELEPIRFLVNNMERHYPSLYKMYQEMKQEECDSDDLDDLINEYYDNSSLNELVVGYSGKICGEFGNIGIWSGLDIYKKLVTHFGSIGSRPHVSLTPSQRGYLNQIVRTSIINDISNNPESIRSVIISNKHAVLIIKYLIPDLKLCAPTGVTVKVNDENFLKLTDVAWSPDHFI